MLSNSFAAVSSTSIMHPSPHFESSINHVLFITTRAQKGAFLGPAAKEGIAILFPDTSPRGAGIEGEDADWDFGTGRCSSCALYAHPFADDNHLY